MNVADRTLQLVKYDLAECVKRIFGKGGCVETFHIFTNLLWNEERVNRLQDGIRNILYYIIRLLSIYEKI